MKNAYERYLDQLLPAPADKARFIRKVRASAKKYAKQFDKLEEQAMRSRTAEISQERK